MAAANGPVFHLKAGLEWLAAGKNPEAESCFVHALTLDPDFGAAHFQLGKSLIAQGKLAEGIERIRTSIELSPKAAAPLVLLGFQLQDSGQFGEAIDAFTRAIELDSRFGAAYFGLATSRTATEADKPLIGRMIEVLDQGGLRSNDERMLHQAVGKWCDDLGEFEAAIRHFDESHRIARNASSPARRFSHRDHAESVDLMIETFSKEALARYARTASPSDLPLLIVGMPRSGTTLVEQILSSHPEVQAGGELSFWDRNVTEAFGSLTGGPPGHKKEIIAGYLRMLREISDDASRVTDKTPNNTMHLGVICALFPNAKIVHCRRHPVDTCLSIYMTPYRTQPPAVTAKENIAFVYEHYVRLMDHWREVLPPNRFFEINYEDLVENTEPATRAMVEFCGLSWADECLRPNQNSRRVTTASLWQVRQPIYSSSIGRWRNYEPWLGPLQKLFKYA